jgi:FkbM family methyltransferase
MKLLRKFAYYSYSIIELLVSIKNWSNLIGLFIKGSQPGEHLIRLRRPPLKFFVRDRMDVWSIKETILDRFYTRYGTDFQNDWVIVDVGAGIGDFAIYAAQSQPKSQVYAFEPFSESFELLLKNIALNSIENIIPVKQAVWYYEDRLALDLSRDEPLQIKSQDKFSTDDLKNSILVDAISLRKIIETYHLDQIDLIKLDCEGAEYEILLRAPAEILARVERIIMEYHDFDAEQHHQKLSDFLKASGFIVKQFDNFVHEDIGYLYAERQN